MGWIRTHNARLDDDVYHRRSVVESVFATLKQRYGDRLTARTWYGQFRELAIKAAVNNIDSALGTSHH
jgi:IS5 family transposase